MTESQLFRVRLALLQRFLQERGHDGILLSRCDNYAMATGGKRNFISTFTDMGANSLYVSRTGRAYFVGNNIEATRQMAEELGLMGCEVADYLWHEGSTADTARRYFGDNLVSDDGSVGANVHEALAPFRAALTQMEMEKYKRLGVLASEAMMATLTAIRPGMLEADIAAILIAEGAKRRCHVPVSLVAADKRIARFRHPLPTVAPLMDGAMQERAVLGYVMVVGCFMREGLVVSMTRFRQVGDIAPGTSDALARIAAVDALTQESTLPGKTLGDVFADCQAAYPALGFRDDEWRNHHQGGATGYGARTCKGAPGETFSILDPAWTQATRDILGNAVDFGMAFAWNPSAPGVKSEDTFLLSPDGRQEIITATPDLPLIDLDSVLGRPVSVRKSGMMV